MSAGPLARALRRASIAAGIALSLLLAPATARAQDVVCDPGDLEVRRLSFDGNRAFSDAELANAVVTTASSGVRRTLRVVGERRCLDRVELPRDVLRLILFYRNHGYYEVSVDTALQALGRGAVGVTFRIEEGAPTIVDSVTVTGLAGLRDSARILRDLPVKVGLPFDRYRNEVARDTIVRRLRNSGYPRADALLSFDVDRVNRRAAVRFDVVPGAFARFGEIDIEIEPLDSARGAQLSRRTVRRALGIRSGQTYRESALEAAKRNLYQSDAYRHVEISVVRDTSGLRPDSLVDVRVEVAENHMHAVRVGAGWGTLDCLRMQGSFVDRDFLDGRGRLELTGRLSKLWICPSGLGQDPYSDTLNYFAGATLRQPVSLGLRTIPTLTIYSERRSEYKAFLRTTPIGGLASFDVPRRGWRPPMTVAYQLEQGRTTAEPALFCAVFNLCTEEDRRQVQSLKRLAVTSWSTTRDRTDNPIDPGRGTVTRLEWRHASNLIGSDPTLEFNRGTADMSWYRRIGDNTLAARLRLGAVFGSRIRLTETVSGFIPPQERLYAGGPNSVRGFRQNELGPAVYVVSQYRREFAGMDPVTGDSLFHLRVDPASPGRVRTVPTGGNSVIVGTVEYRLRSPFLPTLLQWAAFTDLGQVWNRGDSLNFSLRDLKITPGLGLRAFTPFGAIRVDVGYNAYSRSAGAAYFETPTGGSSAPLLCVSPGNTIPVRFVEGLPVPVTSEAGCPSGSARGFTPAPVDGFFRRLTFNFSIGQAF